MTAHAPRRAQQFVLSSALLLLDGDRAGDGEGENADGSVTIAKGFSDFFLFFTLLWGGK